MKYGIKSAEILRLLETYNKDIANKIEIAKVYAILDLADAIQKKTT